MKKFSVPQKYRFVCWITPMKCKVIDRVFKTPKALASFLEKLQYNSRYIDVECDFIGV